MPAWALNIGARILGKKDMAQRLLGSLQVGISKTRDLLNRDPPVSVDEALQKTTHAFLHRQNGILMMFDCMNGVISRNGTVLLKANKKSCS